VGMITNDQKNSLISTIHNHADNLVDGGGGLELTREAFPDYEEWRCWRDKRKISFSTALEMGRMVILKALEEEADRSSNSYKHPVDDDFLESIGLDLEESNWEIRNVSPADLFPLIRNLNLSTIHRSQRIHLLPDPFICHLCENRLKENSPWSIIDGKRQHILEADCKAKRK